MRCAIWYHLYNLKNVKNTHEGLSNDFRIIGNWFHENLMVLKAEKCHYICFGTGSENDDSIYDSIF